MTSAAPIGGSADKGLMRLMSRMSPGMVFLFCLTGTSGEKSVCFTYSRTVLRSSLISRAICMIRCPLLYLPLILCNTSNLITGLPPWISLARAATCDSSLPARGEGAPFLAPGIARLAFSSAWAFPRLVLLERWTTFVSVFLPFHCRPLAISPEYQTLPCTCQRQQRVRSVAAFSVQLERISIAVIGI